MVQLLLMVVLLVLVLPLLHLGHYKVCGLALLLHLLPTLLVLPVKENRNAEVVVVVVTAQGDPIVPSSSGTHRTLVG